MKEKKKRDFQRKRVYQWQNKHIVPIDKSIVPFDQIGPLVNAIWAELDLKYPPVVESLPKHRTRAIADADRLILRFGETAHSWLILHELAHSLTFTHEQVNDGHGENFMGMYVKLLVKYMRLDESDLLRSLREAKIAVNMDATPVFVDGE